MVKGMGVSNLFVHTINNNDISKVYEKAVLIQGNFLISGLVVSLTTFLSLLAIYTKRLIVETGFPELNVLFDRGLFDSFQTMEADLDVVTKLVVDKINQYEPNQVWNNGLKLVSDQPQVIKGQTPVAFTTSAILMVLIILNCHVIKLLQLFTIMRTLELRKIWR